VVKRWRAHVQTITSIDFAETARVLISSSIDCTIRVWTPEGKYIGTFGQEETWNLYDPMTYKHPTVPYDILIDEQSMPPHPILNVAESFQKIVEKEVIVEKPEAEIEVYKFFISLRV
jgi:WD40 repeat protein